MADSRPEQQQVDVAEQLDKQADSHSHTQPDNVLRRVRKAVGGFVDRHRPNNDVDPNKQSNVPRGVSRREFLKWMGAAAGAVAATQVPGLVERLGDKTQLIDVDNVPPTPDSDRDALWLEAESKQTLSKEFLAKMGIHIHDLPEHEVGDDFVELEFTSRILEHPLFQRIKQGRIGEAHMFLINGATVDVEHLIPSQLQVLDQYPAIKASLEREKAKTQELNREEIIANGEVMREHYRRRMTELQAQHQAGQITNDEMQVHKLALEYQFQRYLVEPEGVTGEMLNELEMVGFAPMQGGSTGPDGVETKPVSFVFMAVGESIPDKVFTHGDATITVPATRLLDPATGLPKPERSNRPDPDKSYPSYDSLEPRDTPDEYGYKIGNHHLGALMLHEMMHGAGIIDETFADEKVLEMYKSTQEQYNISRSKDAYYVLLRTSRGLMVT